MHAVRHGLYSEHVTTADVCRSSVTADQILSRGAQYAFSDINMNRPTARNSPPLHPPYLKKKKSYDVRKHVTIYH
jgi:hypothetical protein